MSAMKIHGNEYTINKVFSDDFAFEIPHYQRPYRWTTEQAGNCSTTCSAPSAPTQTSRSMTCRRTSSGASS